MRWNVLFSELEHRFDEMGHQTPDSDPPVPESFTDSLRASLGYAREKHESLRVILKHSGVRHIRPRTIGRDFVAGEIPDLGADAVLSLRHIAGFEPMGSGTPLTPVAATLDTFLRVWAQGHQPCVLVVEGSEWQGFLTQVREDAIFLRGTSRGTWAEWVFPRESLELIRSLSAAEKERLDG